MSRRHDVPHFRDLSVIFLQDALPIFLSSDFLSNSSSVFLILIAPISFSTLFDRQRNGGQGHEVRWWNFRKVAVDSIDGSS